MKTTRQFYISYNPRASDHATPYHIGELIDSRIIWWEKTYGTQDQAREAIEVIYPKAIVSVD